LLRAQREDVRLDVAVEERVRVLDGGERARCEARGELLAADVAQAVGADLPRRNELLVDAGDLDDGDVGIPRVREVEVDALDAEPREARVDLATNA